MFRSKYERQIMFDEEAHIAAHRIEKGSAKTVQDVMARFEDFMNASYGPELSLIHISEPTRPY